MRRVKRGAAALAALCLTGVPQAAAATSAEAAEDLVRQVYYEGVPEQPARALGPEAATRLAELLADPAETRWHVNAAMALALSGQPAAYDALAAVGERGGDGELTPAEYRLRIALPRAMGVLAQRDDRALAWLIARASQPARDPGWSYGALHGPRLARQMRLDAVSGLGISERREARALLQRLAAEADGDPAVPERAAAALAERPRR